MADLSTDRKAAGYSLTSGMKQFERTAQGRNANFKQFAQGAVGTRGQANNKYLQELTRIAARKTGSQTDTGFQRLLMAQTVEPSDTEKAIANFQALVERIPGVLAVRVSGGQQLNEKRFVVVVPSLFDEATRGIYELRGNLFRKFPTANLDVRVEGIREGGRLS